MRLWFTELRRRYTLFAPLSLSLWCCFHFPSRMCSHPSQDECSTTEDHFCCICCYLIFNILPLVTPEISELLTFYFCILRTFLCTLRLLSPENLLNDHMWTIMHSTKRMLINNACKWVYFFSNQCLHSKVVAFHFSCIMNLMYYCQRSFPVEYQPVRILQRASVLNIIQEILNHFSAKKKSWYYGKTTKF